MIHDNKVNKTNVKLKLEFISMFDVVSKVNCISTEFTAKRHGGEKGVPFRIQVETYSLASGEQRIVHCASCQVKVFKVRSILYNHDELINFINGCNN